MKRFRFRDKIETSLNLFSLFISKRLSFRDLRFGVMKTQTQETNKEKRFKLVSFLLSKMFYGHAMFIGGGSRYLSSPVYRLSRPVDTKTDFNLNNIIATLSLISISSVKKSPANVLTRTQT